jgi:hypothetical protein
VRHFVAAALQGDIGTASAEAAAAGESAATAGAEISLYTSFQTV